MIEQVIDSHHDAHVHLLGCLDASDLIWICEKFGWPNADELLWFEREYSKFEVGINFEPLHQRHVTVAQLRSWLECRTAIAFPRFQASFNLLIAMLRGRGLEGEVLVRVAERHARAGLVRVDYRVFVPPVLEETVIVGFLNRLGGGWDRVRKDVQGFDAKIVGHLSRIPEVMRFQLGVIFRWQQATERRGFLSAIDFCEDEQSYEVRPLVRELAKWRSELKHRRVELYVHAGECFDRNGIDISLSEIEQLLSLRPDRIGHGTALGMNVRKLQDLGAGSDAARRQAMWTKPMMVPEVCRALTVSNPAEDLEVSGPKERWCEFVSEYQDRLLRMCRLTDVAIETCPSSNLILGGVHSMQEHPVRKFVRSGVNLMIGSDDPGIFAADWYDQVRLIESSLN